MYPNPPDRLARYILISPVVNSTGALLFEMKFIEQEFGTNKITKETTFSHSFATLSEAEKAIAHLQRKPVKIPITAP